MNQGLFQDISADYELNEKPIVLIDISGSTSTRMHMNMLPYDNDFKGTVREYEFHIARLLCYEAGYGQAHLIVWSDKATLYENTKLKDFDTIKHKTKSNGGTTLKCGIDKIKPEFYDPDRITEIYIVTDGEICDDSDTIKNILNELNTHNIQIKIVAVEPNKNNYLNGNVSVGNNLYKIINEKNMSRLVSRFSVYNCLNTEFVNMSNPRVKTGFIPYGDKMFESGKFKEFVMHVHNEVKTMLENKEGHPEKTLGNLVIKLAQNLSISIYHLIKDTPHQNQIAIIDLFCNIFKDTDFYANVRTILHNEVNNQTAGKVSTFSELRKNRHINTENLNIELMNNVKKAVCGNTIDDVTTSYTSFLLMDNNGNYFTIKSYNPNLDNIRVGFTTYNNCAISVNDRYKVPILFNFDNSNQANKDAALQWLKFIYSQRLNISIANEYMFYYVLCSAYIANSDLYNKYANLILNDKKYNSEVTIIADIIKNKKINIPYGTMVDAAKQTGLNINPIVLYYIVVKKYILPLIKNNDYFVTSLRAFCLKEVVRTVYGDYDEILSITSLRTFRLKEVAKPFYGDYDKNEKDNWKILDEIISDNFNIPVESVVVNEKDIVIPLPHNYDGLPILCSSTTVTDDNLCQICKAKVEFNTIKKTPPFEHIKNIRECDIYDTTKHIHLGRLTGISNNYDLVSPDNFDSGYKSFSVDNTMIIDPISSSKLKILNQKDFADYVNIKYPFLQKVSMDNIALCGGFVRSTLLKQQMKDFDFFFYGLQDDQAFIDRVKSLTHGIIKTLKDTDDKLKFCVFYKPKFNVVELICYEDPGDHIKEDFTLDFFDQYKFRSMRRFTGHKNNKITRYLPVDMQPNKSESYESDDSEDSNDSNDSNESGESANSVNSIQDTDEQKSNDSDESDESSESGGFEDSNDSELEDIMPGKLPKSQDNKRIDTKKFYFEEGDKTGIKMKHRFQFVMCKYNTISDIFKTFDLFPSMMAYDGKRIYFTEKSLQSVQYMINEINLQGGTDLIKHRLSKYFKYGFNLVFPEINQPDQRRDWKANDFSNNYRQEGASYTGSNENIGPLSFKVRRVVNNMIYINHGSNYENMLNRNEELEKAAMKDGTSLYTSNLFCSFQAVLRYVKINEIPYSFPLGDDVYNLFNGNKLKLKNKTKKLKFIDHQTSIYNTQAWYPIFVKSILLKKYE